MPTGYTHGVQEGKITTLQQYAMTCARAFGALILMRDDPLDAPIPQEFQTNTDYHDKAIEAAREILALVPAMSDADCDLRAAADFDAELTRHTEYEARKEREKNRYETMLDKVEGWSAPDDLGSLKDFMASQLRESIKFDCSPSRSDGPVRLTGSAWREKQLADASRDLSYHEIERQKEIDRTASRNEWLRKLRASFPHLAIQQQHDEG